MSFATNRLGFCIFAALMSLAAPSGAADRLTLVADEWPPFSGSDLPGQGISIDVTRAVLTRAGYEVETAILPWARVVHGAQSGEYDIVTSLFLDAEMQKHLYYSEPFYTTEVKFVQKKGGNIAYSDLQSIRPFSIAVGTGFLYAPEFDDADFLKKVDVTTTLQGIQMVAAGHVDLTLDSTDVIEHSILRGDRGLRERVEFLEPALIQQNIHMAVTLSRSDHAEIVANFNKALADMKSDGSFDRLFDKHAAD